MERFYDADGHLTKFNGAEYKYDWYGNRIEKRKSNASVEYLYSKCGLLTEANGTKYSYDGSGRRVKKTSPSGLETLYYLDGAKILRENRNGEAITYFYDKDGVIGFSYRAGIYKYVYDSQGNVAMITTYKGTEVVALYEYDAYGNCKVYDNLCNEQTQASFIGNVNPFRWKGFYYDTETGLYYANGSYYDPETGLYVDASPIDIVIDNALTTVSIDRNGLICNNVIELAGNLSTLNATELSPDPTYEPKLNWLQRMVKTISDWWRNISVGSKVVVGAVLVVASVVAACYTGGASLGAEAELLSGIMATSALATAAQTALIDISIGIGFAVVGWTLTSAVTGTWSTGALSNSIADAIFFTGVIMFISASVNALKYIYRSDPYPAPQGYKMANKGHSQGGLEPTNLKHQLALEQTMSTPTAGTKVPITMGDTRWAAKNGWIKMQQEYYLFNGEKVTIHYVMNPKLMLVDDFKIIKIN